MGANEFTVIRNRATIDKAVSDTLDYTYNLTKWLGNGGDIVSPNTAPTVLEAKGVTVTQLSPEERSVTIWVKDGVVGVPAWVTLRVTSRAGRIKTFTLYFKIVKDGA